MNTMNLYVYENRSMSTDISKPIMLENHNVDSVQVHIPQEIDGTDMGTWAWWFVFQNARKEKYSIPMTLEEVTNDDEETEYISAIDLNHGFTGKSGTVMYAIEAVQADGAGTVTHEWHTRTYKLEIIHTLQGNQAEHSETESDIISALISRVNELIQSGAKIAEIAATIEAAAATAQEVINSIPQDYTALSEQVDTNTESISDIKADLDALEERVEALEGSSGGLTSDIKSALMNLVNHVTFDDDDPTGQTYITALQNALYPPAEVVGISAVYTQSGAVYETDSLDDLKEDLVVTALMSDQTTRPVTDYTLSGTLTEGTSTITVSYGGKTATFNVIVSHEAIYVKNLVEEGTLLREHAWGTNGTSTNPSWIPSVYSISDVRSGDVLILPNGWNSANWKLVRNIGTVDGSDSIPDCTQGESWVQSNNDYGYYPITMNEDVETLYVSFYPTYGSIATWTREGGF